MWFINEIVDKLNHIAEFFYDLYLTCYFAGAPLSWLANSFYYLAEWFNDLAWLFYSFGLWVDDVATKVLAILNWSVIWSYILSYVPNIEAIRDWFYYWRDRVWQEIADWWAATSQTVIGWIDAAKDWAWLWIDYLQSEVNELKARLDTLVIEFPDITELLAWFSNWWSNILGNLDSWWSERLVDVQSLINSAFIARDDFWRGWQDQRDKVTEFFTDPEDWLYKAFDRIIERFW